MEDPGDDAPPFTPAAAAPITPFQRAGALVEVLLCSGFPTQVLLIALLTGLGMPFQRADGDWSPRFVFTLSLLDAILVVALVVFFIRARGERVRDVLLGQRPVLREVGVGLALLPLILIAAVALLAIILALAPDWHNVAINPLEAMLRTRWDAAVFAVVVMVAGGVREEVQRGFILHRFGQYLGGGLLGVVVHSAAFGLGHVDQGWDAALTIALLGAAWGLIYLKRRSIVAPMVSHAGFNLVQLVTFVAWR